MPTYPKLTPEDFIRLSELTEVLETARNELAREVMHLFPGSHPTKRLLMSHAGSNGFMVKIKSGLENSARSWLGPSAPAIGLFYGPDRQQYRDQIRYRCISCGTTGDPEHLICFPPQN